MKTKCEFLIAKQKAGNKLSTDEIRTLMMYALELLREFGAQTQISIDRAKAILKGNYEGINRTNI